MLVLKIKKRYFLKKKKVKAIKEELGDYGSFINNKDTLEMLEAEDYDFILVNTEFKSYLPGRPNNPAHRQQRLWQKHFT